MARLIKYYYLTQQQLSDRIGKPRVSIANTLRLLNLATDVKDALLRSDLSMGHAKVLLSLSDLLKQSDLAKQVIQKKLTVRQTQALVDKHLKQARPGDRQTERPSDATSQPTDDLRADLADQLAQELQKTLGTRVQIDYSGGRGKLKIHFYSNEELNQIAEKKKKK